MSPSNLPIVVVDLHNLPSQICVPIPVMITHHVPPKTVSVIGTVINQKILLVNLVVVPLKTVFHLIMNLIVYYKDVNLNSNVTLIGNSVTGMEPSLILKKNNGIIANVNSMDQTMKCIDFIATRTVRTKLVVKP